MMLWLMWKQHRGEALVGALLVVVIAIALISMGLSYSAVSLCIKSHSYPCQNFNPASLLDNLKLSIINLYPKLLPLLIGVFVGAPLIAREREQHTYPLIWTQSITRNRWLTVKLGMIAGILVLVFTLFAALSLWDYSMLPPVTLLGSNGGLLTVSRGAALIGLGLFGLMLGVAIGAFVRRVVPAMVLTGVVFLAVLIALSNYQLADPVLLFQWLELAVLLALSAALVSLTYWRLRQRRES
jgi:hypothetical protein